MATGPWTLLERLLSEENPTLKAKGPHRDSPLMRPTPAAKPKVRSSDPDDPADVFGQRPGGEVGVPKMDMTPAATKAVKPPTAAMDRQVQRLPQSARGKGLGAEVDRIMNDPRRGDQALSPDVQFLDPKDPKQAITGWDYARRALDRKKGSIPAATPGGPGSSPEDIRMPSATAASQATIRGEPGKTPGRVMRGQTKIKVAPPGQAVLPVSRDAEDAQPKFRGTFFGQRWRPRGQSVKTRASHVDKGTGDWVRYGREQEAPGTEFVWDGSSWIRDDEFRRQYPSGKRP